MTFTLSELDLLDSPPESDFDNLTLLASRMLGTPVSLVSVLDFDGDRQFFKSHLGLPEPWATQRQTPLTHSFCQHVVRGNAPLVVGDAPQHPLVHDNLAVRDLNVIAYLGAPFHDPDNRAIGALCAIDGKPREWRADQIETIVQIARCVSDLVRIREEMRVSERLERELQQSNQVLDTFALTTAQNLGAPLRVIGNEVQYLEEDLDALLTGEMRDSMHLVRDRVARMDRFLDGLLQYGRIGRSRIETEAATLGNLVEDVTGLVSPPPEFTVEVTTRAMDAVAMRMPLQIVLTHLVDNAIRHHDRDAGRVLVDATPAGERLEITVRDDGPGIPEARLEDVFAPFHTLKSADDRDTTGMGLAIARKFADLAGGLLTLTSDGRGTTAHLAWPAAEQTRSDREDAA